MTEAEVKALRLSPAMKTWLADLYEGRDPTWRLRGMSAHGGADGTIMALVRRGLICDRGLTEAGRQVAGVLADRG